MNLISHLPYGYLMQWVNSEIVIDQPASSCSLFPYKTKSFENTCLIMMKSETISKIQNKMPHCLMAKEGFL